MIQRNFVVFTASAILFLIVFSIPSLIASQENSNKPSFKSSIPQSTIQNLSSTSFVDPKLDKAEFAQKTKKLQIPFIANNGQVDKQVKYYANTFGGTVFVTKEGEIVYALPNNSSDVETQCLASSMHSPKWIRNDVGMLHDYHVSDIMHPASWIVDHDKSAFQNPKSKSPDSKNPQSVIQNLKSGVAIKETLVGGRVQEITGNEKAVTKVSYFKGNVTSQWKGNISTYETVSLGEVYDGIELKLKAYGNNVEKLFCVKPDADLDQIQVNLSGAKDLRINDEGQLVAETEIGAVKFTKPVAYQEINGKRVDVRVEYRVESSEVENKNSKLVSTNPKSVIHNQKFEYGFNVASYDKSHALIIDPLLASTFFGGNGDDYGYSITIDSDGNIYLTGQTTSPTFPTTSGAYDNSRADSDGDAFVSKLSGDLTNLIASTFLGGSSKDYCKSITLDSSGNIYVSGVTSSSDFPTTTDAYDTSYNGYQDAFVSKLSGDLTSLLASTLIGGYSEDYAKSIAINPDGNLYITGNTKSSDFPVSGDAYKIYITTSNNSDVFVSILNENLTSLLSSTFLGVGYGYSIITDSYKNVYVTGETNSSDFPTTAGAYDTSNNSRDAFISKFDSDLTSLLASTFLGGSSADVCTSISLDPVGNIYVTGETWSSDFPITKGAYDTSYDSESTYYRDAFVSKLSGDLTNLIASTYLGGSIEDYGNSIALDPSGNIYVTGETNSSDFPTTTNAYDTSSNGGDGEDVFVSKLSGDLTSILSSTYLGGSSFDYGYSIVIDSGGNIYVTGETWSSDFSITKGAYDTSYDNTAVHRYSDTFLSKLDSDLSASTTSTPIPTPPPVSSPSPLPTLPPLPTPIPSPSLSKYGQISGYMYDMKGNPVESVKIRLKRPNSRVLKKTFSDEDGFFEFTDLYADTYIITAIKKGYKTVKQAVTIESGEEKDIEIVMKKANKRRIKMIDH